MLPPLVAPGGIPSDHDILAAEMDLPHRHDFHWVRYKTREMKKTNHNKFNDMLLAVNWEDVPAQNLLHQRSVDNG